MFRTPRFRFLLLTLLPLLISAAVMSAFVSSITENKLRQQHQKFAQTLTKYLAMTSAEHLVNRDLLGINVLLTRMQDDATLQFASVYDSTNQLVAQVGQRGNHDVYITNREITFQDTSAGYIQAGFSTASITEQRTAAVSFVLVFHAGLMALCAFIILFLGDFVAIWAMGRSKPKVELSEVPSGSDVASEVEPETSTDAAILVIKLIPTRLFEENVELLSQGISLYGGNIASRDGDSFTVYFSGDSCLFDAACTALLLLTLVVQKGPPLTLKLGMHWIEDRDHLEKATKHASYLASISEQNVLASASFEAALVASANEASGHIQYDPFHSSLTPDGEVIHIQGVSNQDLIQRQALQLLND